MRSDEPNKSKKSIDAEPIFKPWTKEEIDKFIEESLDEPLDELDWPENQIDDDGSDDWCKNGW